MRLFRLSLLIVALAACSDGPSEPDPPGPPATIVQTSTTAPTANGGTTVTTPITLKVQDASGRGVPGQTVSFSVVAGGGSLTTTTAVTNAEGIVTVPAWTLGKSAVPQTISATVGAVAAEVNAQVTTAYAIDVRFFGDAMSAEHQALFTNAAARLRAIITGDVINVAVGASRDLATDCGIAGLPTLPAGQIDDVIIYAAVQPIDGAGKILAQAGPCLVRDAANLRLTVVGVMSFDIADLTNLTTGGRLQDVITHEMLHVLGIGTLWKERTLIVDAGLETVNYNGPLARAACIQLGGGAPCSSSVPVENTGGAGTRDGHWRESTFDTELMTGFAENSGPMPLSLITTGALADLGYVVNNSAADPYTVPAGSALMALRAASDATPAAWESVVRPTTTISPGGRVDPMNNGARVP